MASSSELPAAPRPQNKEEVYDYQIGPLMETIIGICKKHGIAMLASFKISTEEHPELSCTTSIPDGEYKTPPDHQAALDKLTPLL